MQDISAVIQLPSVILDSPSRDAIDVAKVGSVARRWLEMAVVISVVTVLVCSGLLRLVSQGSVGQIQSTLGNGQAGLLFAAASLGLLSGRWAARTSAGFAGATLLVLAFAGITSATSLGQNGFGPVIYTASAALAVALLLGAAAAPEVNDAESFQRLLTREDGPVALVAMAALTPVVEAVLVAGMTMPLPTRIVLSALVATGFSIAATRVLKINRSRLSWLPAVLVILAAAALVRGFVGVWSGFLLIALGLEALAGAFTLLGAVLEVRSALVGTNDGMTSMLQDLGAMRDADSLRRAQESERLHEVRSVLAGLNAARATLRKLADNLDPDVRRRLQDAVGEELGRLNQLIDPAAPGVTEELDLEAVLTSVVVAQREQGLVVTTDLAGVSVWGRAAGIATLVSDLLVNSRVHAPDSEARLTARADGGVVTLEVRNWGPGLSAIEAGRVFERSYRGARSIADGVPGSGLGLFTARRLARQMHGDLRLRAPAGGGCCFVVTLPVGGKGNDPAPSHDKGDQINEPVDIHPVRNRALPHHARFRRHDGLPAVEHVGKQLFAKDPPVHRQQERSR